MKFKLDFVELESLRDQMGEVGEAMEEFEEHFGKLKEMLLEKTDGESYKKLDELTFDNIEGIKKISEDIDTQRETLDGYLEGIRDINKDQIDLYKLDTNEVRNQLDRVQNKLNSYLNISNVVPFEVAFMDKYESNISEFENVDGSIDISEEYEDDPSTQSYIRERRSIIKNLISNYKNNRDFALGESISSLKKLEDYMELDIEVLKDFKAILKEMEEFEETYNPGFLDKHGKKLKVALNIAITVFLIATPIPGDAALFMSVKGAKYLPKLGRLGKYTLRAGSKIKASWTLKPVSKSGAMLDSFGWLSGFSKTPSWVKGSFTLLEKGTTKVTGGILHTGQITNGIKNISIIGGTYEVVDDFTSFEFVEGISDFIIRPLPPIVEGKVDSVIGAK